MTFTLKTPPLLKKGDTVATVSPSWGGAAIFPHRYKTAKKQFEETFGLKVVEMPHALCSPEELDKNPQARAADINAAVKDPDIKAIITAIGGDDSVRLLPYLDYRAISENPKFFIGYSDPTALHFAFLKAGVSSVYGPAFLTTFAENGGIFDYAKNSLNKILFSGKISGEIAPSKEWTNEFLDWSDPNNQKKKRKRIKNDGYRFLLNKAPVQGRLIGGCLEVLEMIKGSPVWPDKKVWKDCILFIDLSEEAPSPTYIIRCLRNYAATGILKRLRGILVGRPCNVPTERFNEYDEAFVHAVSDEAGLNIPIVTRMDFGHTDPICCLPYGALAEINPVRRTVSLI
ncbi:MAG: LD-carboxypeptidase [Alphaproteobacteria bacterium]|nr:LD-carboxypeptidase [Alphaproteobacteria bacterium]